MQFIEFQNQFKDYLVFSLLDIQKIYPNFSQIQLNRWKEKGYLTNVKQGYYCLSEIEANRNLLFYISNRIYFPSYISLEMALAYYNLIPEEVFQITSVCTKKTMEYQTAIGNFIYQHIKPSIYFGYKLTEYDREHSIIIAEPEKALLDYFYLNPQISSYEDFIETRINQDEFDNQINLNNFKKYLKNFGNKSLAKRMEVFMDVIRNA